MDKDKVLKLCDAITNIATEEPAHARKAIVHYENAMAAILDYMKAIRSEVSASPLPQEDADKFKPFVINTSISSSGWKADAMPNTYTECPTCHNKGYVPIPDPPDSAKEE